MSSTIQQLIDDRPKPITVQLEDNIQRAFELMIEHDYSQLPVVDNEGRVTESKEKKAYIVTSDSILRAIKNFRISLHEENLRVADAMVQTSTFSTEDDPFDLFKELRDNQAVIVENGEDRLVIGIVTSFDATSFFRKRAEDIILIEEIESTIKDYITLYFRGNIGETDQLQLQIAIDAIMPSHNKLKEPFKQAMQYYQSIVGVQIPLNEDAAQEAFTKYLHKDKSLSFDDLSLSHFIDLFTNKARWDGYKNAFRLERNTVYSLLDDIRKIRNKLMHFRDEISPQERQQLRYCKEWLLLHRSKVSKLFPLIAEDLKEQQSVDIMKTTNFSTEEILTASDTLHITTDYIGLETMQVSDNGNTETIPTEIQTLDEDLPSNNSRYAPLAFYLFNKPVEVEGERLTFGKVEEIIKYKLPESAYHSRSWWANDSVGHVQSQQWLNIGWRVSYVDMEQQTVLFTRMHEREQLYDDFFRILYEELSRLAQFELKPYSPKKRSWITIGRILECAYFNFAFTYRKRFRIELYIDTGNVQKNKDIFDKLLARKNAIELELNAVLSWERLDGKRAARIAYYHDGSITDESNDLSKLREWAIAELLHFQPVMEKHVSEVIHDL
jgi:predicted transcriptional regulator